MAKSGNTQARLQAIRPVPGLGTWARYLDSTPAGTLTLLEASRWAPGRRSQSPKFNAIYFNILVRATAENRSRRINDMARKWKTYLPPCPEESTMNIGYLLAAAIILRWPAMMIVLVFLLTVGSCVNGA